MRKMDTLDIIEKGGIVLRDVILIDTPNARDILHSVAYERSYECQLGKRLQSDG